jgi:hypothetical protein
MPIGGLQSTSLAKIISFKLIFGTGIFFWISYNVIRSLCSKKIASFPENVPLGEDEREADRKCEYNSRSRDKFEALIIIGLAPGLIPRRESSNNLPQGYGSGPLVASAPSTVPNPSPNVDIAAFFSEIVSALTNLYIFFVKISI